MSIPGSVNPLFLGASGQATGGGEYQIERSVRFNSADSAYLNRTPGSSGNRKTWTWAGWVKKCSSKNHVLLSCVGSLSDTGALFIDFLSDDSLRVLGWSTVWRKTTQVFRDPSAWFHLVVAFDSTQSTANNRIRVYVNGSEVTTFATLNNPTQNTDFGLNQAALHQIGRYTVNSVGYDYLNAYLADVFLIDGQALTPSSFGEFDTNGVWQPIDASGLTYGTNGFHLPFSDNSTAATLGTDTSGNGNDWTVNNLSVTAGAGNDSLVDSPTSYGTPDTGVGNEVRGNYCTWNPNMTRDSYITYSNGNLDFTQAAYTGQAQQMSTQATIGVASGKWYWEVTKVSTDNTHPGVSVSMDVAGSIFPSAGYIYYNKDGSFGVSGFTLPSNGASNTAGDVIGVALDADNRTVQFFKNGASQGTATNGPTGQTWFPSTTVWTSSASGGATCNFGQRLFAYTAPSGFKALCTTNLPEPTIADGSTAMDVKLYTGNGSTQTISGLNFDPDLVWIKGRSGATDHALYDTVRTATKQLESNTTTAETTAATGLTAFATGGFSLGALAQVNTSSATYAAWTWDAGSSTVTNTEGSITSQVRANASAGFSVVTWTGVANGTVGHGLGVSPEFIIAKSRTQGSYDWVVYHKSLGNGQYIALNSTAAAISYTNYWGTVSATTFLGNSPTNFYNNGGDMVAYCWSPVAGYSSFGSYTGNGSADGVFAYLGFRPRWVMIKRTNTTGVWGIWDSNRNSFNASTSRLQAESSNAELNQAATTIDILSNGFKPRATDSDINASGSTYIYAAFAEHPFQSSRAR